MKCKLPIGLSDFRSLREQRMCYVDKTLFIREVIDDSAQVLLLPRPRRFGKTLNLSTLRYYFERTQEDLSGLFEGLAIWEAGEEYRRHFQRYPVIFLTFKDVKTRRWADCEDAIAGVLAGAFAEHRYLLGDGQLSSDDSDIFRAFLSRKATRAQCWQGLKFLSDLLARHHGEKVLILVDEYDTPIHAGFAGGYYDDVVEFFRNFLSAGLKDNPHLFKGVLTGILRVARESIFSGLNNLAVHSVLSRRYATAFGFTEAEVEALANQVGLPSCIEDLRRWYDGYLFGGEVLYNPWSVLNYLYAPDRGFRPYWVSTSSDDVLRDLILRGGAGLRGEMEELLHGGVVEKEIDENIVLRDVHTRPDAVWSFLLFSGYLKAVATRQVGRRLLCSLAVPNEEVMVAFHSLFLQFMNEAFRGGDSVEALVNTLLRGDANGLERLLEEMLIQAFSYQDLGGQEPERVYQAFILGLLVWLEPTYEVRSNRESGHGRYDVMILPRQAGQPGVVLEIKVLDKRRKETPEQALESALRQIRDRGYAAELRARGARPVHEIAAVFDRKRAYVRSASGG